MIVSRSAACATRLNPIGWSIATHAGRSTSTGKFWLGPVASCLAAEASRADWMASAMPASRSSSWPRQLGSVHGSMSRWIPVNRPPSHARAAQAAASSGLSAQQGSPPRQLTVKPAARRALAVAMTDESGPVHGTPTKTSLTSQLRRNEIKMAGAVVGRQSQVACRAACVTSVRVAQSEGPGASDVWPDPARGRPGWLSPWPPHSGITFSYRSQL